MSEEDTKVVDIFDKDIENFGNDLEKMIEHLNIVIATHNKQVDEIERLKGNNQAYQKELCRAWEERDILYRRISKAIEYLEKRRNSAYIIRLADGGIKLINILKGSEKE